MPATEKVVASIRNLVDRMSLRLRVVLVVLAMELLVLSGTAYLMLQNAREAVREEVSASVYLARRFAIAAVGSLLRGNDPGVAVSYLPTLLQQPRHVRLHIVDADQGSRLPVPAVAPEDSAGYAPAWFERLIGIAPEWRTIPIDVGGRNYGAIVIVSEPRDEIAEIWTDFSQLLKIYVGSGVLLIALLHVAVGYSLRPLGTIRAALGAMQAGHYRIRVPALAMPDLAAITSGCNTLAASLQQALAEKDQLNQRLVRLQDTERKNIALELHDEFGPCLFGIKAEADSLAREAGRLPGGAGLVERAESILGIVSMMQVSNRALLNRLRPMAVGQLPLGQVVTDLVRGFVARSRDTAWRIDIDPDLDRADDTVEITVYRVTQEALTNALRHGQPRAVAVSVRRRELAGRGAWFRVRVADDGAGLPADWSEGIGLQGMRERVDSLGGRLRVRSRPSGGTMVVALIPGPAPVLAAPAAGAVG